MRSFTITSSVSGSHAHGPFTAIVPAISRTTVAGDWFGVPFPMQGIKSTSIVFPGSTEVATEPFALFCEEDRNGCHLEVYPRPPSTEKPNGEVYLCGLGGSDYVDKARLSPGGDCDRPEKITADLR